VSTPERPPEPSLAPGARPAPRYEILAHLSRTGWLDVYDAWSEERECRCVLKILRPDRRHERRLRDRLLREGRWLRGFSHPNLVRAYDIVELPEPVVVLETLTGETLSHLIHRLRRRLAADDLAFLGLHLTSATHYLHQQGLLHLDIKPSNVIIDCRRAKLLDLSVARAPGVAPPGIGTFCYLSPEQARGGELTAAADVWGIGITLYEAATGDIPFDVPPDVSFDAPVDDGAGAADSGPGDADTSDVYPQLEQQAPPVGTRRRLPHKLAAVIDGCLRPHPGDRPTVAELITALDAFLPQGRRYVPPPPDDAAPGRAASEDALPENALPEDAEPSAQSFVPGVT
jgi:eukaryotic-like serine/threonine-protein kinase